MSSWEVPIGSFLSAVPVLVTDLSRSQLLGLDVLGDWVVEPPANFSFLTRVVWMSDRRAVSLLITSELAKQSVQSLPGSNRHRVGLYSLQILSSSRPPWGSLILILALRTFHFPTAKPPKL